MGHHTTTVWEQKSDRNSQQPKAQFLYLTEGVISVLRKSILRHSFEYNSYFILGFLLL
jgi:hypothetical protein